MVSKFKIYFWDAFGKPTLGGICGFGAGLLILCIHPLQQLLINYTPYTLNTWPNYISFFLTCIIFGVGVVIIAELISNIGKLFRSKL